MHCIRDNERPAQAARKIAAATPGSVGQINDFARDILNIRGGRLGSGMGLLLESLWGYYTNDTLDDIGADYELGWITEHQYNDFGCLIEGAEWDPETREGELLRVETKSMNTDADESKGHFDEIQQELGQDDLLFVLLWSWDELEGRRLYPRITDHFVGRALPIAKLRDRLHLARGGSFVDRNDCPDGCDPDSCPHHGQPLNANDKRERLDGPQSCQPPNARFAANFGGLVRMLKTNSAEARNTFYQIRYESEPAHEYISFIYRNFPNEEYSQYIKKDWLRVAEDLGLEGNYQSLGKDDLVARIRSNFSKDEYHDALRELGA